MPDKRQNSKQRRAARNRASRQALAARRDNAVAAPPPTRSGASSGSGASGTSSGRGRGWWRGGAAAGAPSNGAAAQSAPAEPPPSGIMGMLQSRRTGDKAVLTAFVLSVVAAIFLLFYQVPADDRGEPLPGSFRGLSIAAREQITGDEIGDNKISLLDASGPQLFLVLALPIFVTLFALWANRRPDRSRMLTFAMLGMAAAVIMTGGVGIFFFPALIALAIGGFRVRKADLPARVAERATGGARGARGARGRGGVIDADSTEVTGDAAPQDAVDEVDPRSLRSLWSRRRTAGARGRADAAGDEEAADAGTRDPAEGDEVEYDPLAELEAELEAERDAESRGDDERR